MQCELTFVNGVNVLPRRIIHPVPMWFAEVHKIYKKIQDAWYSVRKKLIIHTREINRNKPYSYWVYGVA